MKLEWPIFTSTSPLLLLRPMVMRVWRIIYSKSLPSNRAIAGFFGSGLHARLDGLAGADLRANNAHASWSEGWCNVDILAKKSNTKMAAWAKAKQGYLVPGCLHHTKSRQAPRNASTTWTGTCLHLDGATIIHNISWVLTRGHLCTEAWPNILRYSRILWLQWVSISNIRGEEERNFIIFILKFIGFFFLLKKWIRPTTP